ncbi:MAG: UDP-2,3-diacylglucosamine diphosphatase LpxI [Myxococcota bacterium]
MHRKLEGTSLGLIAGSGRLPFEVAEAAHERGLRVAVVAIEDNTDPAIESQADGPFTWVAAGELGRLIEFLKGAGVVEAVLAGAISKREILRDPSRLRPDARAMSLLSRLEGGGDDAILRAVADEIESEGIRVVPSTAHLADRMTREGPLVAGLEGTRYRADLELGLRVARALGEHDVGQTVVVKEGAVVAVEALEGTDATIRRAGEVAGQGAVAVKVAKPTQDLRFDVPVIGPETLEIARSARLAAIGLEAGATLVLEPSRTFALAKAAKIPIVGLGTSR